MTVRNIFFKGDSRLRAKKLFSALPSVLAGGKKNKYAPPSSTHYFSFSNSANPSPMTILNLESGNAVNITPIRRTAAFFLAASLPAPPLVISSRLPPTVVSRAIGLPLVPRDRIAAAALPPTDELTVELSKSERVPPSERARDSEARRCHV